MKDINIPSRVFLCEIPNMIPVMVRINLSTISAFGSLCVANSMMLLSAM